MYVYVLCVYVCMCLCVCVCVCVYVCMYLVHEYYTDGCSTYFWNVQNHTLVSHSVIIKNNIKYITQSKGDVVPAHTRRKYKVRRGTDPLIHIFDTRRQVARFTPQPFYSLDPWKRRRGGPQGRTGHLGKEILSCFYQQQNHRLSSPLSHPCTDYAMLSHRTNCIFKICAISRELRKLHWWTF